MSNREASRPYIPPDGKSIVYAGNESKNNTLNIYRYSISNGTALALSSIENLEEYCPIFIENDTFLFKRWEG